MTSPKCSYCNAPGPLTREHLWPAALHRRHLDVTGEKEHVFWLRRTGTEIASEPTVRDVCATCNNVRLSVLDGYICELFDRLLAFPTSRFQAIEFEYDYHLLKRWLLKICFNSARIHNAKDLFVYETLRSYMLGLSTESGRCVQLYLQLSYPDEVPVSALREASDAPAMFFPTDNRVGQLWFVAPGVGRKLLRAVHIHSYSFFLAFFQPGEKSQVMQEFTHHFLVGHEHAALLRASRTSVSVVCDGMSAWESFSGSRENSFIFSDD